MVRPTASVAGTNKLPVTFHFPLTTARCASETEGFKGGKFVGQKQKIENFMGKLSLVTNGIILNFGIRIGY
jgi:hypothetical protein